jgi:ABC-type multidrug transport system permease subunit
MDDEQPKSAKLGVGGWIAIVVLVGLLLAAIIYAVQAWGAMAGVGISTAGWVFMALGVIVTTAVGAGLMGLVFYSSRKNFDQ